MGNLQAVETCGYLVSMGNVSTDMDNLWKKKP